jgi:hypothetical protein
MSKPKATVLSQNSMSRAICPLPLELLIYLSLGVKADVQLKSSIPIGAKVEISPKGFKLGVKAEIGKRQFQSAPS